MEKKLNGDIKIENILNIILNRYRLAQETYPHVRGYVPVTSTAVQIIS